MKNLYTLFLSLFISAITYGQASYCTPIGDCIEDVTSLAIGNNTHFNTTDCAAEGGYTYFASDTLLIPSSLPADVVLDVAPYADGGAEIFVDWNKDTLFSIEELSKLAGAGTMHVGALIPPDTITQGTFRLRVLYGIAGSTSLDGCENQLPFGYLRILDYNLKITDETPALAYCPASGDPMCSSITTNGTEDDTTFTFIDRVSIDGDLGGVNNITACDEYGDYTALQATWTGGTTYNVVISSGTGESDVNNNAALQGAVYIDWNSDTVFNETEMYPLSVVQGDSMFIAIPASVNAVTGFYRMRIRLTALLNTPAPCGEQSIGEVEDYTIYLKSVLTAEPECVASTNPADGTTDLCTSSTLSWTASNLATNYVVKLFPKDATEPEYEITTADTFFTPENGLLADTSYTWVIIPESLTGTQATTCDSIQFVTAPVIDPVAEITPVGDTLFTCKASNLPLFGAVAYPANITHTWYDTASFFLDNATIENPVYNNVNEDTLKLVYSAFNDFGCGGIDSTILITLDGARLDDYYIADVKPCEGDSVIAIVKGAIGNIAFEDSTSGNAFASTAAIQLSDTSYYLPTVVDTHFVRLSVQLGDCDVLRDTIRISVVPMPTVPQVAFYDGEDGMDCLGSIIGMRITNFEPNMVWNDISMTNNDTIVSDTTGAFFVNHVFEGCAVQSDTLFVQINDNPDPEIHQTPDSACVGDVIQLFVDSIYASVKWSVNTADSVDFSIDVFENGTYTLTAFDDFGCEGTSRKTVSFNANPTKPSISFLDANPACVGSEVRIAVAYSDSGMWNTGDLQDTLFISEKADFFYVSENAAGCTTGSDTVTVSFFDNSKKIQITAYPPKPYCVGDTVVLVSQFTNNNVWSTGSTNDSIVVTESGNYFVEGIDQNGCEVSSNNTPIVFGEYPDQPDILRNGNRLMSSIESNYYEWLRNGVPMNEDDQFITVSMPGRYQVRIFNSFGCESPYSEEEIVNTVGIQEELLGMQVSVYPNPSKTGIVNIDNQQGLLTHVMIDAVDGKRIMDFQLQSGKNQVPVLAKGHYIFRLYTENDVVPIQVLVH